ncbi:hypothetical protein O0882_12805 [Janthinobacterium sp. SUN073]|uniref:hypothetical protein n=1 Tax=Janthinobacterium sp. SUN073 TaxID=3004102 RepID=UPI0025B0EAD9|nr:hypothetical protein [Janthinobacterium sp. SUN073]MDN2697195.1 hypothetical protein [Janthinobacterium sp. SUN073]
MITETTQATPATTALTLPQRAAVALGAVDYEAKIKEQVAASTDITAVIDPAGREQAHRIGMNLLKLRTGIKAVGEAARKDATDFSKAVIAKEKDLIALITPEENRVFELRDAYDTKVEAEKQAAIAKERERITAIQADIAAIHDAPLELVGKSAADIQAAAATVAAILVDKERFAEFEKDAAKVVAEVSAKLASLHAAAVENEEEAARIAAERAELAQLREAAAEARRIAQVEADRIAAQRQAEDDRRAALAAEQEAKELRQREAHAAELKKQADAQAEQNRLEQAEIARQRQELLDMQAAAAEATRLAQVEADRLANDAAQAEKAAQLAVARAAEPPAAQVAALTPTAPIGMRRTPAPIPPAPSRPAPAPDLLDAAADDLYPSDSDILDLMFDQFGLTAAEAIDRLAKFDFAAARAGLITEAA